MHQVDYEFGSMTKIGFEKIELITLLLFFLVTIGLCREIFGEFSFAILFKKGLLNIQQLSSI